MKRIIDSLFALHQVIGISSLEIPLLLKYATNAWQINRRGKSDWMKNAVRISSIT
ncbi:MAG: hypothetical protein MJ134_07470 [Lachnospiraceae bacterium]|nr:hypothetical protein [Lachnospiraceae bacterium]